MLYSEELVDPFNKEIVLHILMANALLLAERELGDVSVVVQYVRGI